MKQFSLVLGNIMFHRDLVHYSLWKMMEAQEHPASIFGIQDGCSMFVGSRDSFTPHYMVPYLMRLQNNNELF
jgi:hypothetical protein